MEGVEAVFFEVLLVFDRLARDYGLELENHKWVLYLLEILVDQRLRAIPGAISAGADDPKATHP